MISYNKHDIFVQNLKRLIKREGLTNALLAEKLNYSEHAVKRWLKTTEGNFPSLTILVKISEIFNVDVAYLLGEQECEKISTQRIVDLTGLSEEAADKLEIGSITVDVIDGILRSEHLNALVMNAWKYSHSHYIDVSTKDKSGIHIDDSSLSTDIFKFNATTALTKILEEMYKLNSNFMDYSRDVEILRELFAYIDDICNLANENPNAKKNLLEYIALKTQDLTYCTILKNVPDLILNNYKAIAKQLEIDYKKGR